MIDFTIFMLRLDCIPRSLCLKSMSLDFFFSYQAAIPWSHTVSPRPVPGFTLRGDVFALLPKIQHIIVITTPAHNIK